MIVGLAVKQRTEKLVLKFQACDDAMMHILSWQSWQISTDSLEPAGQRASPG
jgi:hypothetical protein